MIKIFVHYVKNIFAKHYFFIKKNKNFIFFLLISNNFYSKINICLKGYYTIY